VDRTERLLNLVLCLLSASAPVGRETIRRIVAGYDSSSSDSSFERMFERDKDELRAMGIPLETVATTEGEVLGYRICRDDYRLPPIEATAQQWALLGLAGRAWSAASLEANARTALRKLEGIGAASVAGGTEPVIEWHSRPEAGEQWLATLWNAIRLRQVLTFDYLGLRDDQPNRREVQPWSILGRGGGWYLIAWDTQRQAPRSFRLSRIVGDIEITGPADAFTIPAHDAEEIVDSSHNDSEATQVWIALAPGSGGRIRMSTGDPAPVPADADWDIPEGFDILRVVTNNVETLTIDVAELGEHARILHPVELQYAVIRRWSSVLSAHDDPATDLPSDRGTRP